MKKAIVWIILFVSFNHLVIAEEYSPAMVYGVGTQQCGEWLNTRKLNEDSALRNIYEQWVLGYITAGEHLVEIMRHANGKVKNFKKASKAAVYSLVDNRCQSNPLTEIEVAVRNVLLRDIVVSSSSENSK